jgi:hypothetical protein
MLLVRKRVGKPFGRLHWVVLFWVCITGGVFASLDQVLLREAMCDTASRSCDHLFWKLHETSCEFWEYLACRSTASARSKAPVLSVWHP